MRYSLVLATLAASAIATPYINVEVSEPEAVLEITNNNDHHHRVDHGHNGNRGRHNHRNWLSTLFGGHDDVDDDDNRRRHRRNGRGRNGRGRNGRGRNGRGGRDGRRGDLDDDDNDEFHIFDDISENNYECNILASSGSDEKDAANDCCHKVGGELYDVRGRCIFRDIEKDPRDEWRNCALKQRGVDFAECYKREQREVDDELDNEHHGRFHIETSQDRDDRRDGRDGRNHHRNGRDGRDHHRNGRNGRDGRDHHRDGDDRRHRDQSVLGNQDDRDDRRRHNDEQYECRIQLDNEELERDITRQCCQEQDVQGRLRQNDQRCEVRQGKYADRFEECANRRIGGREEDVQCRRINNRRDL